MYSHLGKQVFRDGEHFADAATPEAAAEIVDSFGHVARLIAERDIPETQDWLQAVEREAAHQRARWSEAHDEGKTPFDWFWLLGYLCQKAAHAALTGDDEKARHHIVTSAAALRNWHLHTLGQTNMRPGIAVPLDA